MKIRYIKYWAFAAVLGMGTVSCEDFLNRPTEDNYNESNFYQNDEQCVQGVNYLYTVNGTDENLVNMSYSLWAVIGHANTVYTRLKTANASEAVKNQCMGECLAWKAMAYFYLVRSFGAVPIIHDNTDELNSGNYNSKFKVEAADVYEYIIMTLEKAMELLPARGETGRIDRYCAEGLLAKVYLTKSGLSGTRNADDLAKAAEYSKDVINNSVTCWLTIPMFSVWQTTRMKSVSSPGTGRQDVTPGHSRIRCSRTWQWWDSMNLVIAGVAMQVRRLICRMHLEFPLWKVLRRVRIRIPVVRLL